MFHARMLAAMLSLAASTAHAEYTLSPYETRATGSFADTAAIGDVNGDGLDDVVLTTTFNFDEDNDHRVHVYLQQQDGTLDDPIRFPFPYAFRGGLAIGNLDGDVAQEIVAGHELGITIIDWDVSHERLPSRISRTVRLRNYFNLWSRSANDVVLLDANRDGALDILAQHVTANAVLYAGDGQGGVRQTVSVTTAARGFNDLDAGDFNGDGYDDFVVLSGQGQTYAYAYFNNGTLGFSAPMALNPNPDGPAPMGAIGVGDFDDDGRDDLIVRRDRTHLSLFAQSGGQLQFAGIIDTDWDANALQGHDLDLDGRQDLLVLHGGGTMGFHLQSDDGLSQEQLFPGPEGTSFSSQGVAAGDINGDGCTDIAAANYNYGLVLYRGEGCQPVADLAVNLGLSATAVAVRLDNFGAATAAAPETGVTISVTSGTLAIGVLPAGCATEVEDARSARIECHGADIATSGSQTLLLPMSVQSSDRRSVLTTSAHTATTTAELRPQNNAVRKSTRVSALVGEGRRTVASK